MVNKRWKILCTILMIMIVLQGGLLFAGDPQPLEFALYLDDARAKIFDERGFLIEKTDSISHVEEGWIIQTLDKPIEMTLSLGALTIGPNSLISIDTLQNDAITIYIIKGSIRAVSDAFHTKLTCLTPKSSYVFTHGDFLLEISKEERFYINRGDAHIMNLATKEGHDITSNDEVITSSGTNEIAVVNTEQRDMLSESLPVNHYKRPVAVAAVPKEPDQKAVQGAVPAEPSVKQGSIAEPEPDIIIAKEEPPAPAVTIEPEIEEPLPDTLELILPVSDDKTTDSSSQEHKNKTFGVDLRLGLGFMHKLTTSSDTPYIVSTLYPHIIWNDMDLGLRLRVAFQGNPLSLSNWYRPRGDLLWNYGGGAPYSLALINDITTDALSIIDFVHVGSPEESFYLNIDDRTPLTFGHGTLLRDLSTSIDAPYINRTGFYQTLHTKYYSHELLIDDISYARLYGARFAVQPIPDIYPFTIGVFTLADIDIIPTKIIMTPGIDLSFPIVQDHTHTLTALADAAGLMLYDSSAFDYAASYANGLQNYMISSGVTGSTDNLSYSLLGQYNVGYLSFNMFGDDYQWRRGDFIANYDPADAKIREFGIYGDISYKTKLINTDLSYYLPSAVDSFAPSFDADRITLAMSGGLEHLNGTIGFSSDGMISSLLDGSYDLFSPANRLYGSLTYTQQDISVTARYSQVAEYDGPSPVHSITTGGVTPTLSVETTIKVGGFDKSTGITTLMPSFTGTEETEKAEEAEGPRSSLFSLTAGVGSKDARISSEYDSPYTSCYLFPGIHTSTIDFGLRFGIDTNGNPFDTATWLYDAGNTPWDFVGSITSTGFYDIRENIIDLLSFIDHITINSEDDPFFLRVSNSEDITLGHGTLISHLNTAIDAPFINRTALYSTVDTKYVDSELLVNDLSNPQMMAVRLGVTPIPDIYAFEVGLSSIIDLTFEDPGSIVGNSATKMLWVPGLDISLPIAHTEIYTVEAFSEFALLTVIDEEFKTDAFMGEGTYYNYLINAGFDTSYKEFSMTISLAYSKGALTYNLFGNDYAWRREAVSGLNGDYLTDRNAVNWELYTSLTYEKDALNITAFFSLDLESDFSIHWPTGSAAESPDLLGVKASYDFAPFTTSCGYVMRGLSYNIRPGNTFNVIDISTQVFADITYTAGRFEIYGRASTVNQYEPSAETYPYVDNSDAGSGIIVPAYTIGTNIHLF